MKTKLKEFIEFRFLIISANKLFVCETGRSSSSHEGRPTRLFSKCPLTWNKFSGSATTTNCFFSCHTISQFHHFHKGWLATSDFCPIFSNLCCFFSLTLKAVDVQNGNVRRGVGWEFSFSSNLILWAASPLSRAKKSTWLKSSLTLRFKFDSESKRQKARFYTCHKIKTEFVFIGKWVEIKLISVKLAGCKLTEPDQK